VLEAYKLSYDLEITIIFQIHNLFFKLVKRPDDVSEYNIATFTMSLDYIQEQLRARGTKFLHGNIPGYADYMIWPWFERLRAIEVTDKRAKINAQKYDKLASFRHLHS
jgi:pyrimidodiazepine synthase